MKDPKGGVAKVTCPTFIIMGQIPAFHRTYFLLNDLICHYLYLLIVLVIVLLTDVNFGNEGTC